MYIIYNNIMDSYYYTASESISIVKKILFVNVKNDNKLKYINQSKYCLKYMFYKLRPDLKSNFDLC